MHNPKYVLNTYQNKFIFFFFQWFSNPGMGNCNANAWTSAFKASHLALISSSVAINWLYSLMVFVLPAAILAISTAWSTNATTFLKSSSLNPLEVRGWAPRRAPPGNRALLSLGTLFLLMVMQTVKVEFY